jgi:hypothetical protein
MGLRVSVIDWVVLGLIMRIDRVVLRVSIFLLYAIVASINL